MKNIYTRLLENTQDGVYQYRFEDGEILLANQSLIDILDLNYSPQEIVGKKLTDIFIYVEKERTIRGLLQKDGCINNFEYHFKTLKGDDRWVIHDSILWTDEETGEKIVESIVKNITERKLAERHIKYLSNISYAIRNINQLINREKDVNQLLKGVCQNLINSGVYSFSWCFLKNKTGGISFLTGMEFEEELNAFKDYLTKGEMPGCVKRAIDSSDLYVINNRSEGCQKCPMLPGYKRNISISAPLKYDGKIYGAICTRVASDNTDFKEEYALIREISEEVSFALHNLEMEEDRDRTAQMLQLVMDNIPQFIFWKDLDSVFLGCNKNFADVAGIEKPEDIIGKTDYELAWKKEESDFYRECDRRVMNTDTPEYNIVERQLQANGKEAWLQTNKIPLHDQNGEVVGILGTYQDITERIQHQEQIIKLNRDLEERIEKRTRELMEAQEKLLRKEKLEVMGQLAGSVSHELRNPLGTINNSIYFLKRKIPTLDSKCLKHFKMMEDAIDKASNLVRELLDYGKTPKAYPTSINVKEVVEETIEELRVPDSIDIELPNKNKDLFVSADIYQVGRIFFNLLKNAIQAMPMGGKLKVTWKKDKSNGKIEISDTGNGISKEDLGNIFEPLYTTKDSGTGLGLPLCKRYIEFNKGSINVTSSPGKGSAFKVSLPLWENK